MMIKRSGALFLAILYSITVIGFALNLHYCGQMLSSVKINATTKGCGMFTARAMKCCRDKQIEVKVKDAHQGAAFLFLAKSFVAIAPQQLFSYCNLPAGLSLQRTLIGPNQAKAPPGDTPFYLKNRAIRI